MRTTLTLLSLVLAFGSVSESVADRWVFTSPAGAKELVRFRFDEASGELTERKAFPAPGNPFVMNTDPAQEILYVSFRDPELIGAYRIDHRTGELKLLGQQAVTETPAYLVVDQKRRALFGSYYRAGLVMVHRLQSNGALADTEPQVIKTAERAHAVMIDPGNRFVYVPHTRPESIFGFRYDPVKRGLKALAVTKTPAGFGPRHLHFHPNGKFLFVDNEQGDSLTRYDFNAETGALKAQETLSTIPEDWTKNNTTSDFQITSDGRFAYVINRGHNSLAMISIDPQTGRMKSLGQQPIGEVARLAAIPPGDRFILIAGTTTGKLAVHAINQQTGRLTFRKQYEAGPRLWWVLSVPATAK